MIRATAAIIVVAGAAALAAAPESLAQFPSDETRSPEISAPSRSQPPASRITAAKDQRAETEAFLQAATEIGINALG